MTRINNGLPTLLTIKLKLLTQPRGSYTISPFLCLITNLSILPLFSFFLLVKLCWAIFIHLLSFRLTEFILNSGTFYFYTWCFSPKLHIAYSRSTLSSKLKCHLLIKASPNSIHNHALLYYILSSFIDRIYLYVCCFSSINQNGSFRKTGYLANSLS